jgi:hypothetical protein
MAAEAIPLVLKRVCPWCVSNPSWWLIVKSTAKQAFLLNDKDLAKIPSCSVAGIFPNEKSNMTLYHPNDVKELAFAKWGGADGLEAEISKRAEKAIVKHEKSQSTPKPQKKRPKIEKMPKRPAENLQQLRAFVSHIPIGSAYRNKSGELKMTPPVKCSTCNLMGSTDDIVMHERLEHGVFKIPDTRDRNFLHINRSSAPENLTRVVVSEEALRIPVGGSIEYTLSSGYFVDNPEGKWLSQNCLFTFGACKISVDLTGFDGSFGDDDTGTLQIWFQTGSYHVPKVLLYDSWGLMENATKLKANEEYVQRLKEAIGLSQTSSVQLLAMLISRAMPIRDFLGLGNRDDDSPYFDSVPLYKATRKLLRAQM